MTALGALATTGAAVSGCCAPPILLSLFGTVVGSTGALTEAFVSPASPLGELFFVGAATLLVRNSLRTSQLLEPTCEA